MCFAKVVTRRDEGRVDLTSQLPPVPAPPGSAPALLTAPRTAASVPPSLGTGVTAGESESEVPHDQASLRSMLYNCVDDFCDKMGNEPEEAQMEAALAETEEELSKDVCEFIEDHIQENLPESLQESSPLLQQARQEVRRRIQRRSVSTSLEIQNPEEPSVSTSLEVQNPEESIWARALRRFQGILRSLQQRCWDVLTWLGEMAAACLQAISSAVIAILGALMNFCFPVGHLFRFSIQV